MSVLPFAALLLAAALPGPDAVWTEGPRGRIGIRVEEPARHDGSPGKARIELEPRVGAKTSYEAPGTWQAIGHIAPLQAFALGGLFEAGAWLPLQVVELVDDVTGKRRRIACGDRWMAFAAAAHPQSSFVAFLGARKGGRVRVHVVDLATGRLWDLAPAPAPPPLDFDCGSPAECADRGFEAFGPIEADVLSRPDAKTLRVSYGADSWRRRAKKRAVRTWRLDAVAKRKPTASCVERPP